MNKKAPILFFCNSSPNDIGGMEAHANAFKQYFLNHSTFPLLCTVGRGEHSPSTDASILFFNSGHWIEEMDELKKQFPKALFIYRTGGNEILQASLKNNAISMHNLRQQYWVNVLNRNLSALITNSTYTEKRLKRIGLCVPFSKIVGGVDSAFYNQASTEKHLSITPPIFFCAARFVPYKNHTLLVRAFNQLYEEGYVFSLKLAGSGPKLQEIQKLAAHNPFITFLGNLDVQSSAQEMARADVYIQLSVDQVTHVPGGSYIHSEGMGRSILEAISSGTFVIAGNSGALSETIDKERGVLISNRSIQGLMSLLRTLIQNPPMKRPKTDVYSWNRLFKEYEKLYENISSHRKVPS